MSDETQEKEIQEEKEVETVDETVDETVTEPVADEQTDVSGTEPVETKPAEPTASDLLTELGVSDVDTIKQALAELKERKKQEMSESERLQAKLDEQKQAYEALAEKYETERKERVTASVRSAIQDAARDAYAHDPATVAQLVMDDATEYLKDDGSVNADAVNAAISGLKEKSAYMFGKDVPSVPANRGKPVKTDKTEQKINNMIKQKFGRL